MAVVMCPSLLSISLFIQYLNEQGHVYVVLAS
jgi:hypothetical protein